MGKEEVFPEPALSEQDRVTTEWQVLFLPNPFVLQCGAVTPTSSMLLGAMCFLFEPQNNYRTDSPGGISLPFCTRKRGDSEKQSDLAKAAVRKAG